MIRKKLIGPALVVAALAAAAPVQADPPDRDTGLTVCNEAENSWRGGYELGDGPVDPVPPAFNRGERMKIGDGAGVVNAAEHSPALRLCDPLGGPTGGGGGDV